jgi:hypothetical protein
MHTLYITKSPPVPPHTHTTTITAEPVNRRSILSSALVGAALAIKFSAAPVSAAALSGEALKKAETVKESIKLLCSGGARSFTSSVFSPCSHYRSYSCHCLPSLDWLENAAGSTGAIPVADLVVAIIDDGSADVAPGKKFEFP